MFVYGSAYSKGTTVASNTAAAGAAANGYVSIEPQLTQFSNSPITIRSQYTVAGSDLSLIHISEPTRPY